MKETPAYIPPPVWTGFYIGGHIGAAWDQLNLNQHQFNDDCGLKDWWGGSDYCGYNGGYQAGVPLTYSSAVLTRDNNNNSADAFGGAQLGYNWQWTPAWVLGIEVDLGGMALNPNIRERGTTQWTNYWGKTYGTPVEFDGEGNGGFYGDVTGRIGWTWGPAMIYAKGGFAWLNADLKLHETVWDGTGNLCGAVGQCDFSHDNNNTLTGWTLGGGLEWKVSPAWSIKAEYLHFEFDNLNNNCCNDFQNTLGWSNNFNEHSNLQIDTVKLGFNYFWNPAPPAPLK